MNHVLAIARRELDAYFAAPLGWLALCGFVFITGVVFAIMLVYYGLEVSQMAYNPYMEDQYNINQVLLPPLYGNVSVFLLMFCPLLSMRLFSEDRATRSFELLMASPVTSGEIVLGKYLGAVGFIAVLLAATLPCVAVLYWLGEPDAGVLAANYLGLLLLASSFMAVGLFTSSLTQSQVVSAIAGFAVLLGLFMVSWVGDFAGEGWAQSLVYLSLLTHNTELSQGLLHIEDIVYFVSFIAFFLFATQQRVEAFRWQ